MFAQNRIRLKSQQGRLLVMIVSVFVALSMMAFVPFQQAAAPWDATRAELRALVENVTGADARRYAATDSAGRVMDTAKIIADPAGGYLAIYHSLIEGSFRVSVATSTDLLNWTFAAELGNDASQPYLAELPNGGFVAAWEQTPNNHLAFRYYRNRSDLLEARETRRFDAPQTLSNCAEGTPNIYSVTCPRRKVKRLMLCCHVSNYYSRCVSKSESFSLVNG